MIFCSIPHLVHFLTSSAFVVDCPLFSPVVAAAVVPLFPASPDMFWVDIEAEILLLAAPKAEKALAEALWKTVDEVAWFHNPAVFSLAWVATSAVRL